jgi:two-component system sensor histidine kinase PilS (NtrC family)
VIRRFFEFLRPSYDGPESWLWFVGIARVLVLIIVAIGVALLTRDAGYGYIILALFAGAGLSSSWYLFTLRRDQPVPAVLTWTQVLVDFGVVAATISFTQGQASFVTFLLVIVILEAGVLMGLVQGFVFATLASLFMFFQFILSLPVEGDALGHWYNYLIQAIAFFFTAFISGYWNQRISRLKQFQREILDNMNSGFLITDRKGLVIAINKAGCQILEVIEGNVAGRHVEGILRTDTGAESPVITVLKSEKDFTSYEFYAETGSNDRKLLGLTTSRLRDSYGRLTGVIASFTDLTEMARMRQELQQQDRLAVVGELSAGLAHEIRNPLASIRSAMDELRKSLDHPKMMEKLANIALRECDHLNEIVTGFLDFAREPSRRREVLDVRETMKEVLEHLHRKYQHAQQLNISLDMTEQTCLVEADNTQLRQVFLNIAQNAVEAMHEKGALRIIVQCHRGPIEIRFEDEGPGIPPDKVARIFEPFYTDKERGVGMGLAVCMRIINAHNGTIQVASLPRGGTSMSVRLPVATT